MNEVAGTLNVPRKGQEGGLGIFLALERNGHLLLLGFRGLARACLSYQEVTQGITVFHPKKPRADVL